MNLPRPTTPTEIYLHALVTAIEAQTAELRGLRQDLAGQPVNGKASSTEAADGKVGRGKGKAR